MDTSEPKSSPLPKLPKSPLPKSPQGNDGDVVMVSPTSPFKYRGKPPHAPVRHGPKKRLKKKNCKAVKRLAKLIKAIEEREKETLN